MGVGWVYLHRIDHVAWIYLYLLNQGGLGLPSPTGLGLAGSTFTGWTRVSWVYLYRLDWGRLDLPLQAGWELAGSPFTG